MIFQRQSFFLLLLCAFLLSPMTSFAHRVNIFAWREASTIKVEARFSKDNPARESEIIVFDGKNQETLLTGKTDKNGLFEFPIPKIASQNGLTIRVNAGEGHQNEWRLDAKECQSEEMELPKPKEVLKPVNPKRKIEQSPFETSQKISPQELQAIVDAAVNHALAHQLGPIREALAKQAEPRIRFIDIIGGVGWIFGIVGVAIAIRSKIKNKDV